MPEQQYISSRRPTLLSALCILTFIGSTIGFIGYFLAAIFFEQVSQLIVQYSSWHATNEVSPLYFTLLMVLYALSLAGAIRMWKLHRDGFFFYVFHNWQYFLFR
jgi:H+/Cl- antiporter ClcA